MLSICFILYIVILVSRFPYLVLSFSRCSWFSADPLSARTNRICLSRNSRQLVRTFPCCSCSLQAFSLHFSPKTQPSQLFASASRIQSSSFCVPMIFMPKHLSIIIPQNGGSITIFSKLYYSRKLRLYSVIYPVYRIIYLF